MINNIVTSSTIPLQTIRNTPPSSSNNSSVINNIVKLHNQPAELINLSDELKQKIAFDLDGISYSNLRLTTKEMQNSLPSFKSMIGQLKNRCSGDLKAKYIAMYNNSVTQLLSKETKTDVIESLKYASVDKRYVNSDSTTISTKFHPGNGIPTQHWNGDILHRCKNEIVALSHNRLIPDIITTRFKEPFSSIEKKIVMMDFKDKDVNYQNLNIIFYAFNKVLNEERSSDRFLVALNARQLKNYLHHNPPSGITKDEVLKSESHYPFLFTMGTIVSNYVSRTYAGNN